LREAKPISGSAAGYFIAMGGFQRFQDRRIPAHPYPMQWYYAIKDQRNGPVAQAEFEQLVANGTITADTLVWRQGMANWQLYSQIGGVAASATVADDGTAVCAVSGKRYPTREMIQYEGKWISAEHRDEYFQRLREGVALPGVNVVPGPYGYGGFWRRVVAKIVDAIATGVVGFFINLLIRQMFGAGAIPQQGNMGVFWLMLGIQQVVGITIGLSYEILFIRKFDATPGKLAMGMKLLRTDGSRLTVGRIIGRYFANWVSGLTIGIGYVIAAFDEEKRALHDYICDTRVIKTR
jgi:uncharacterized RDD family membrane protein YckC